MMNNMEGKYILNPDKEKVKKVRAALARNKEKYGEEYCPCVLPRLYSQDTICACEEYRSTGHCRCGLYIE